MVTKIHNNANKMNVISLERFNVGHNNVLLYRKFRSQCQLKCHKGIMKCIQSLYLYKVTTLLYDSFIFFEGSNVGLDRLLFLVNKFVDLFHPSSLCTSQLLGGSGLCGRKTTYRRQKLFEVHRGICLLLEFEVCLAMVLNRTVALCCRNNL